MNVNVKRPTPVTTTDLSSSNFVNSSVNNGQGDVSLDVKPGDRGRSSPHERELEPLVHQETEGAYIDMDKRNQSSSCWKCKYNWRFFLPVTCCCRGFVIIIL